MTYNIISTGSQGNCLILDNIIAVDMGVPFKAVRPYIKELQLILLTHAHQDHFNRATINTIYENRPSIRFAVPPWLHYKQSDNIDALALDTWYDYGIAKIKPFELFHDIDNCGWFIEYKGNRIIYATDTSRIDHVNAPNFDFYFIEANYIEDDIKERIAAKEAAGEYVYEYRSMQTHLSKEKADAWLMENAGDNSVIEYMHRHKEENQY